jgi:hypothetical protein
VDKQGDQIGQIFAFCVMVFMGSLFKLQKKPVFCRVARWFVFKPKIPIWVNFEGSCNGKSWQNY